MTRTFYFRQGGGISDLIAIDIPNDPTDPNVESKKWDYWKQSVDLIESWTGFDFLSNLPDEVENRIEGNKDFQPHNRLSASLLANSTSSGQDLISPVFQPFLEDAIGHDSVLEHDEMNITQKVEESSPSQIGFGEISSIDSGGEETSLHQLSLGEVDLEEIGSLQIGSFTNSPLHNSTFEIGSSEVSISESSTSQNSTNTNSFSEIGATEVSGVALDTNQDSFNKIDISQNGIHQVGFGQISPTQISPTKISTDQVSIPQVSPSQVGTDQFSIPQFDSSQLSIEQLDTAQIDTSEIPLTSSVPSEQLLSSHNSTSFDFDNSLTASLSAENGEIINPRSVEYDPQTNTATLFFNALEASEYELIVDDNLANPDGITLESPYQVDFTAVSDFSELVDLEFTNTRSNRANGTISFDVALTNQTEYDLSLPLNLVLQPEDNSETAEPTEYSSISDAGAYFIDLSDSLTDGVLRSGESITEATVTINNSDAYRFDFEPAIYTLPTTNKAPVFNSEAVTVATAGSSYIYNVAASDPDGSVIGYVLYDAPEGMSIDNKGQITWTPTGDSAATSEVSLHVYDSRGGRNIQTFSIAVEGGNEAPEFLPLPEEIEGKEGEVIELNIAATDANGDNLQYWVDNLPPGASFDPETNIFTWLPGYEQAGTYEDVRFVVSDGNEEVSLTTSFLIAQGNQAPTLLPISDSTFLEGDAIRIQLQASDTEDDELNFSSNILPGGSFLDPNTGVFEWTPGFFQAGNYEIPFTVIDGESSTSTTFNLEILNVNAAPEFDNLGSWAVAEGQTINFRAFAYDADNPGFVPQERNAEGELTIQEGSDPSVTYSVEGLPEGATFDTDTAIFNWSPDYDAAGEYEVTFTATDDGDGKTPKTVSKTVPIRVGEANRPPVIAEITNPTVKRGEVLDLTITTTDPDSDALTGTGAGGFGLPDFVTLTDNGDGTANLNIAPGDGDRGDHPVTIIATDVAGSVTEYAFVVTVEAFNERPVLDYIGDKVAVVGELIKFTVYVGDLDEDELSFTTTGLPTGATLTPSNVYGQALFSWTPSESDLGNYPITISVEDSGNGDDSQKLGSQQEFSILVRSSNTAPVLETGGLGEGETGGESTRELSVKEGEALAFTFAGRDADGDELTYSATNLPAGAKLDPVTGELTWTPDYNSAGTYEDIEISVSDGHSSSTQTINIVVENSDRAPVLTQLPLQSTRENTELVFTLKGNDVDGDALLYSAVSQLPDGARLDARTGEFKWQPNYGQAGNYKLEFAVTDSNGSTDTKEVEIVVANVNRAPRIEVAPQIVALGESLEFTLAGSDPDLETGGDNALTYSAENLPQGAVLDSTTGVVKWQPSPGQIGDYVVTYKVSDGEDVAEKNALIRVEAEPTPPVVNLEFTPSFPAVPGQKVVINALADSFVDITEVSVRVNGEELALDKRNRVEYIPDATGRVEVEVTATDAAGRTATTTEILKVRDPEDQTTPIVAFGLGLNGTAIDTATEIVGSVSDSNLDEWVLSLKAEGRGQRAEVLATGFGEVSNDEIATFDPALYANGFYALELTATDIKGRTSTTEIIVEVEGSDKQAQYQRVDNDLSVDLGGTAIDLTRRYDSLQRDESGAYGNGWQSSWNFKLETDVEVRGSGNEGITPFEVGTRLYLTTPDGERAGFTFQPIAEEITGLTYYRPAWVADAGVNFILESTDVLLSKAGDRFYDLETARPYNLTAEVSAYTLAADDGTIYHLDATGNLQEQVTSNGTRLIYSDSGILNPDTGEMVRFKSDEAGRLTTITAPKGTSIIYTYDEAGNLASIRNLALGESTRYGYGESGLNLIAGDTGEAIEYFDTPVVKPIAQDLGTASTFTGLTTAGNGNNLYSFGFRDSEILSTATEFVLLSVDVSGTDTLPEIAGLTPVDTRTTNNSSFALYKLDKSGLNLLKLDAAGDYTLELGIAGDVNGDNAVDSKDSQLVTNALGTAAGDTGYEARLDINRDRTIDATDLQILGSNYGFRYNQAPVVSDGEALTHEDLSVEIPLADLANDPEGDRTFFRATDVENGTVSFTPDGQTAIFKPEVGYTGTASFKLFADDGYAVSEASIVEINVSDAPITSLNFVERNPKLEVGEQVELQVIADFADQEDVIVPGDYLNWSSENEGVATVSDRGIVTSVSNGTSIFTAERDGLSAVTSTRSGQAPFPTTEAELNTAITEYYGLDVYPDAVTLTEGVERQIVVGIEGQVDSPDLSANATGTRYFVDNPEVISVTEDGLITTLTEGEAEVTVIHGGTETVIPVNVETPNLGATTLSDDGGIVESADGYQVMVPEGALAEEVEVEIQAIDEETLTTPLPEQFETIDAFNLELGEDGLATAAQLAIPAPAGLEAGTEVFFMRDGELPDETGTWNPIWFVQDSGIVGDDGMIRTSSPPWPAVKDGGDYIVSVPKFEYQVGKAYGAFNTLTGASSTAGTAALSAGVAIGGFNFGAVISVPFFYTAVAQTVETVTVPKIGTLPFVTKTGVELNPNGIPTANVVLDDVISITENDPFAPPVLEEARFDFNEIENINEPIVYLTGSNFLVDDTFFSVTLGEENNITGGNSVQDLTATFYYGRDLENGGAKAYEGEIIPSLSRDLGNNRYEVAVKVPQTVALGNSSIELTREQEEFKGIFSFFDRETVQYSSDIDLTVEPTNVELTLAAQAFNALSEERALSEEETTIEDIFGDPRLTSRDLLLASIPIGTGGDFDDDPRGLVATKDATRAYVALRESGAIGVVDLMTLRQIDTNPDTPNIIEPIEIPGYASTGNIAPYAITTSSDDRYLYVGDYNSSVLYIIDIDPNSERYHQLTQTISLGDGGGVRSLAVNSDGTKLFATVPGRYSQTETGKIYAINIDPAYEPGESEPDRDNYHELIGSIEVEKGVEGISATPEPDIMVFTNRNEDFKGFGRLTMTSEDPGEFAADVSYTALGLDKAVDYFDVNDARDVVITSDGKYGFVAGFNGRNFGSGAPSIDGPKSGSNVGIIIDPLTENAKLIAGTRPIPMGLTSSLSISSDDKYLFAAYPGVGGVYAWDVEEMIATLENPTPFKIDHRGYGEASPTYNPSTAKNATKADFGKVPIDNINPEITIASDLQVTKDTNRFNGSVILNEVEFGVPEDSKRAPLTVGFNPWSIASASYRDWLRLKDEQWREIEYKATSDDDGNIEIEPTWVDSTFIDTPIPPNSLDEIISTLGVDTLPELESVFVPTGKKKRPIIPDTGLIIIGVGLAVLTWIITTSDVVEVELNISTSPSGEGLFSEEDGFVQRPPASGIREDDLKTTEGGIDDYNPNRVSTVRWKQFTVGGLGQWEIDGDVLDDLLPPTIFPYAHLLNLTSGQKYYYGVRAKSQTKGWETESGGDFTLPLANIKGRNPDGTPLPFDDKAFSSVTFITPEASAFDPQGLTKANAIAQKITKNIKGDIDNEETVDGTVLKYDPDTGKWDTVSGDRGLGKPLVLIADWSEDSVAKNYNSGYAEGAADSLFASLVAENSSFKDLNPDALFNSPFHFIGMGRGAVVNSEIIQRLGTFYPKPVDPNNEEDPNYQNRNLFPDLQMTTVDPNDFEQYVPDLALNNYFDPAIQVWNNVTYADNYYQTASSSNPRGRHLINIIPEDLLPPDADNVFNEPDLSLNLGGYFDPDGGGSNELYDFSRVGFTPGTFEQSADGENPYNRTFAWYGGTNNVSWNKDDNPFDATIHRRKGDFSYSELNPDPDYLNPWYTPTHTDFQIGDEDAQWEGIGTGWYYSPQGGGYSRRALTLDSPQSVTNSTTAPRTPLEYDNTHTDEFVEGRMRGDFAVPTLFNSNFDAIYDINDVNRPIPGWSLHNGLTG